MPTVRKIAISGYCFSVAKNQSIMIVSVGTSGRRSAGDVVFLSGSGLPPERRRTDSTRRRLRGDARHDGARLLLGAGAGRAVGFAQHARTDQLQAEIGVVAVDLLHV